MARVLVFLSGDPDEFARVLAPPKFEMATASPDGSILDSLAKAMPDAAIVDVDSLSSSQAAAVIRGIRKSPFHFHIPVIATSSPGADEKIFEAFNAGANEFLVKPVNVRELSAKLQILLRPTPGLAGPQPPLGHALQGRYILRDVLKRDEGGVVYSAVFLPGKADIEVALKIARDSDGDPFFTARFARGAKVLASLDHPSIVRLVDMDCSAPSCLVATSLVRGASLRRMVDVKPLSEKAAAAAALLLLPAFRHMRDRGVVHRDIKPDNIIVSNDGLPVIIDFGIAKRVDQPSLGFRDVIHGTPHFVSPEYIKGRRPVDHKTDIYSLGVTLFYCLSGRLPFDGSNPMTIFHKHFKETPPFLSEMDSAISEDFSDAVDLMLVKNPKARFDLEPLETLLACAWSQAASEPPSPLAFQAALAGALRERGLLSPGATKNAKPL